MVKTVKKKTKKKQPHTNTLREKSVDLTQHENCRYVIKITVVNVIDKRLFH